MQSEMRDIDDISWHIGCGFQLMIQANNQENSLYGNFKEVTSILEALVLFLGLTRYLSRNSSPPLCCFRNSLASSPVNCMEGIGVCSIMVNIGEGKEIGCCPWS